MTPSIHTAAVISKSGNLELKKVEVPKAGEGEVLVKVVVAALNPTDWKSAKGKLGQSKPGAVSGCDFAGIVEELGPGTEASGLKVGERVAAFACGGGYDSGRPVNGSFAEYTVATAHFCIPLPDSWTFEQGAQIGVAIYTACQTLYQSLGLPAPFSEGTPTSLPLLVYGASSAVGLYVLQIAKATGFQIFAVCSPKNYDLVKSLGADSTYDYRDPEVSQRIKDASGGKIQFAVDAISEHDSARIIVGALSSDGGKIATVLPYNEEAKNALGPNLTQELSVAYDLIVDRPGAPSRLSDAPKYCKLAARLLAEDKIKPMPTRVWEKGLEGINEAMQYMIDGKVSGEKIVFCIADTPGLA
ncbi:zinc-binding oxidoreductase ToxD [Peniophora sp. CONT]|nr:zinc-binding oxidoreductase ToxD [Peniophora sp. CONT]